jgi:hypothetical protein
VTPVQNLTSWTVPPVSTHAAKAACATCGRNCFCATWSRSDPGNTGLPSGEVRYLEIPFRRSRTNTSASVATVSFVQTSKQREKKKRRVLEEFVALKVPGQCLLVLRIKLRSSQDKTCGTKDSNVTGSGLFAVGL